MLYKLDLRLSRAWNDDDVVVGHFDVLEQIGDRFFAGAVTSCAYPVVLQLFKKLLTTHVPALALVSSPRNLVLYPASLPRTPGWCIASVVRVMYQVGPKKSLPIHGQHIDHNVADHALIAGSTTSRPTRLTRGRHG